MDQANMLSIVGGLYDKLVADVSDAVIRKLKAEATATVSLEAEAIQPILVDLLERSSEVREVIRDLITDTIDNTNLSDHSEFHDLQRDVETLQEKIEELEATPVDADDSDFADAVRSVIRNHI
jgi:polyhydroxyalkanoate synthesis regulator phasin